jgi:DNA repair protein RadD
LIFNLPLSEISNLFETDVELNNFNSILKSIETDQIHILRNPEKLEEIYLYQNIDKFKKKEFRIHLLTNAFNNNKFKNFCAKINQTMNFKNASDKEKKEFIKKIASFEWENNDKTLAFVESFNLDKSLIPQKSNSSKNIEVFEGTKSAYSPMFLYQSEVWDDAKNKLEYQAARCLLQLPTGAGKTKIAMEVITDFLNNNKNATVVWLAESAELLEQAATEFKKIWFFRGKKSVTLNRIWNKNNVSTEIKGSKIIIAGLSKLNSFFKKGGKLKADLIIFDEAHHATAETYSETQFQLEVAGKTKAIGLTATPGRNSPEETEELAKHFNDIKPIKIQTHDKYLSPIGFLQKQGVLSKIRVGGEKIIKIPKIEQEFTKEEIQSLAQTKNPDKLKITKKIGQSHIRNKIIIQKLIELLNDEERQIIYFGTSVEQAKLMYMLLLNFNFKVGFVYGDMAPSYRAEIIKKFQNKEIKCLLNFNVLVAGFDSPSINTVFIGRLTKSANTLFQMIGRGIRGPNVENGTKFCDVYHIQDGFMGRFQNFEQLYEIYDAYYERT